MDFFQIDSFAERPFTGNPAGVCLLHEPREVAWMQALAAEHNAPATAFLRGREGGGWDLRWFTPTTELPLCGHGTLAAAHVLWETGALGADETLRLHTAAGMLSARRRDGWIEMDFPAKRSAPAAPPAGLAEALGVEPRAFSLAEGGNGIAELASDEQVRGLAPDHQKVAALPLHGVIVTARAAPAAGAAEAAGLDIVSRYFAPAVGIAEDQVTGSAHCALGPYWAERLGKTELVAYQASARGGVVRVRVAGDRVFLAGRAVIVLRGRLETPPG